MTIQGWLLIAAFVGLLLAVTKPMGLWLFALYEGRRTPLHAVLGPVERGFYRLSGIDPDEEQSWRRYAVHMLIFNATLLLLTYAVLRLQGVLPLNPHGFAGTSEHLAFNTAVSFATNTNWQSYGGESTMSNLSQMLGLTIHNFLSAATGIALAFAFFRGFARRSANTIGNFWADMTRVTLYLLLPICFVYALFLIASGVPQTLAGSVDVTTLEGAKQTLALGPVASQEAIKLLGTNGGGFFNANSAHPFENPTALTIGDARDLEKLTRHCNFVWQALNWGRVRFEMDDEGIDVFQEGLPLMLEGDAQGIWNKCAAFILCGAYDGWFRQLGSSERLQTSVQRQAGGCVELRHGI